MQPLVCDAIKTPGSATLQQWNSILFLLFMPNRSKEAYLIMYRGETSTVHQETVGSILLFCRFGWLALLVKVSEERRCRGREPESKSESQLQKSPVRKDRSQDVQCHRGREEDQTAREDNSFVSQNHSNGHSNRQQPEELAMLQRNTTELGEYNFSAFLAIFWIQAAVSFTAYHIDWATAFKCTAEQNVPLGFFWFVYFYPQQIRINQASPSIVAFWGAPSWSLWGSSSAWSLESSSLCQWCDDDEQRQLTEGSSICCECRPCFLGVLSVWSYISNDTWLLLMWTMKRHSQYKD